MNLYDFFFCAAFFFKLMKLTLLDNITEVLNLTAEDSTEVNVYIAVAGMKQIIKDLSPSASRH